MFAEAENPVKNIDWITHGEFTEEKGRQQVEEFVLVSPLATPALHTRAKNDKKAPV